MLFRVIVKKYTADLILLTKFKKVIGMEKNLRKIWRYKFHLWNFYSKPKGALVGFFLFDILHFTMFFRGIGISKLFRLIFS